MCIPDAPDRIELPPSSPARRPGDAKTVPTLRVLTDTSRQRPRKVPVGVEPMSQSQWKLYFWLELCSIWPQVPPARVMLLASGLGVLAGCVPPEVAAATMAVGLGGTSIH